VLAAVYSSLTPLALPTSPTLVGYADAAAGHPKKHRCSRRSRQVGCGCAAQPRTIQLLCRRHHQQLQQQQKGA
jgi:hypothetical protein